MSNQAIRFAKDPGSEFFTQLKARVNEYFQSNNISKTGGWRMYGKTLSILAIYFIPYALVAFAGITNLWIYFALWAIMGLGMATIGMGIMHDANHGSYSNNPIINKYVGYIIHFVGGYVENWKIQHNHLHHTFTNVDGVDQDIDIPVLMRFSPHQKRYWIHKFQHIYCWFLYGLLTIHWSTGKDFIQLQSFYKEGLIQRRDYFLHLIKIIFWKVAYFTYILALPLYFAAVSPLIVILGFLVMHFFGGLILSAVFQTAHVVPTSDYPLPNDSGTIENNWAVHQLMTTADFAPNSRILGWFVGGLNFQVVHHLFPTISHIHYRKLTKIVQETAKQFNLPYYSNKNFITALYRHGQMLYQLGKTA